MAKAGLAICIAATTFLVACRDEPEGEPRGRYDIDAETGSVTASARFDGGEATMRTGPFLGETLPVAIPVMPGAALVEATHVTATNGMRRALLKMSTDATPQEAVSFYRAAARDAGLSPAIDLDGPDGATLVAIGARKERVSVHAERRFLDSEGMPVARRGPDDAGPRAQPAQRPSDGATSREATVVSLSIVAPPPNPAS